MRLRGLLLKQNQRNDSGKKERSREAAGAEKVAGAYVGRCNFHRSFAIAI